MVHIILIPGDPLLVHIHIPKIVTKVFGEILSDADEQPVLIESIIHEFFSELDQQLIGQNQYRRFGIFENRKSETHLVPNPVGKTEPTCIFIVNNHLLPSLLVSDPMGYACFAQFAVVLKLLVDPVFIAPGVPFYFGGSGPEVTISRGNKHLIVEPITGAQSGKIKTGVLEEIVPSNMNIADDPPMLVKTVVCIHAQPDLRLLPDLFCR